MIVREPYVLADARMRDGMLRDLVSHPGLGNGQECGEVSDVVQGPEAARLHSLMGLVDRHDGDYSRVGGALLREARSPVTTLSSHLSSNAADRRATRRSFAWNHRDFG